MQEKDNIKSSGKYAKIIGIIVGFVAVIFGGKEFMTPGGELPQPTTEAVEISTEIEYNFRNEELLQSHYEKHGKEMGFSDAQAYEEAASDVVNNPKALHRIEEEDGDDVYYVESTNEFVVVAKDGYIRTYFEPSDGIDYFNRQ